MTPEYSRQNDRLVTALGLLDATAEERLQMIAEYRRRSDAAFATTTKRTLMRTLRVFTGWCMANGHPHVPPIPPSVVAAYVDHCAGNVRASTIETRLWAIGEMHRAEFLPSPCHHRLVVLAMKAVKRKHGNAKRQAPPLSKREVLAAIAKLGQSRVEQRDRALLYAASDSWCRVSELLRLRVEDIIPNDDGSSSMFISRSKTDTDGRGSYGYLSKRGTEAVRQWIETCGLEESDPIFVKSQAGALRRPLDPATVSRIFKRRTGRRDVSAHSTRVGGVQDALGIGCDLTSVMIAGRWTSPEMPARYGRRLLTSKSAAAQVAHAIESAFDHDPDQIDPSSSGEVRDHA